jgi:hypothetical protein
MSVLSYNGKYFRQNYTENQNTLFTFNSFISQNSAVYETMWKNMAQAHAHCVLGNIHPEYVITIDFALQQWSCTYITCLVWSFRGTGT